MFKTVPISELLIDRFLVPGDDVTALAKSINTIGLLSPILIRDDMVIIDGLRRMEAVKQLGFEEVEAFVPETFVEGIEYLRETLAGTTEALPVKPRRIYEIKKDLMPVVWMERGRMNKGIPRGGVRPPTSITGRSAMNLLAGVFGVSYSNISVISRVFGTETTLPTTVDVKKFQQALEDLNEGRTRPGTVIAMMDQSRLFRGTIKNASDQRDAFRNAIGAINGVIGGLTALGPINKAITRDELLELRSALQRMRRLNNQMIKVVTEEMLKR